MTRSIDITEGPFKRGGIIPCNNSPRPDWPIGNITKIKKDEEKIIKDCPFCGSFAILETRLSEVNYSMHRSFNVVCSKNDLHSLGLYCETREEAIRIWNERPE
jgi:hypothetical protein